MKAPQPDQGSLTVQEILQEIERLINFELANLSWSSIDCIESYKTIYAFIEERLKGADAASESPPAPAHEEAP